MFNFGGGGGGFMNDPNRMGQLAAGAAMLQAAGRSPRKVNTAEAMGRGLQAYMGGSQQGMFNQARMAQGQMQQAQMMQQQQANDWMVKNAPKLQSGNVKTIGQEMMATGNPILMQKGMEMIKLAPKAKSFGKVIGPDGTPVHQAFMEDGSFGAVGGNAIADKLMAQNTGRETQLLNPYTGQPVNKLQNTMAPGESARLAQSQQQFGQSQNLAERKFALENDPAHLQQKAYLQAAGREAGQSQTKSAAALPGVVAEAENAIKLSEELLQHPGLDAATGMSSTFDPRNYLAGTNARDFNIRNDQLKGKVFLQAFESLRGAGQITENETKQAQAALARMDSSASQAEYVQAVREFQNVIRSGVQKAQGKAGVNPTPLNEIFPSENGWSVELVE